MVGRPRVLNNPKVVPIILEYDEYLILKEVAFREGKSVSEIIRELVRDYLASRGIKQVLEPPQAGGEINPKLLRKRLDYYEFKEAVKRCEMIYKRLKTLKKKDLIYHNTLESLKDSIRKAISISSRLPSPPEKYMKILIEIMNDVGIR